MEELYERTKILLGDEGVDKLKKANIVIFGVGGVGSFAVEALARAGVGRIRLVDFDIVQESNINRQLIALHSTVGQKKVEVMAKRIKDINPACEVEEFAEYYKREHLLRDFDYVIDAIDMVSAKVDLLASAIQMDLPIISSMGAGNKLDNTNFKVTDISKTHTCPLAKVIRKELRKRDINKGITVVYSQAEPAERKQDLKDDRGKPIIGSISYVPSTLGLYLAGKVIKDLLEES